MTQSKPMTQKQNKQIECTCTFVEKELRGNVYRLDPACPMHGKSSKPTQEDTTGGEWEELFDTDRDLYFEIKTELATQKSSLLTRIAERVKDKAIKKEYVRGKVLAITSNPVVKLSDVLQILQEEKC